MKKTGWLFLLVTAIAGAQQATPNAAGVIENNVNMPVVRYVTPSSADLYCAGLISPQRLPDANYINGTLDTPSTTKIGDGELVYLAGGGYQVGQLYAIMREMRDINEFEFYPGQAKLLAATGHPYGDIGRVRVLDVRSHSAIAEVVFACDPVNPGDIAVPFVERQPIAFRAPSRFDRFLPASDKVNGRIVLGKDFDGLLGTGAKVYLNLGSNQGIKLGDSLRVVRTYTASLQDPVDSLSFKATISEDTQKRMPSFEAGYFNPNKGPNIHVADLPRKGVGEVVVLSVTPTTSTAMIVFALEDVHAGDGVELDNPQ